jgi:WD repeat-containing protein 26
MRPDDRGTHSTSNGYASISNGSTPKKLALSSSMNGHSLSQPASNGTDTVEANGPVKSPRAVHSPTYHGHNREEVTRILIQGLHDMGYNDAAASLSRESRYELESPSVATFRQAIMDGQWTDAEAILLGSYHGLDGMATSNLMLDGPAGLVLAEGSDKSQMLFWMREQKFLEYLNQRDLSKALAVLRQELTPLNHDIHQLHALSRKVIQASLLRYKTELTLNSLLMCPAEDWRAQARWNGSIVDSRKHLLQELTSKRRNAPW